MLGGYYGARGGAPGRRSPSHVFLRANGFHDTAIVVATFGYFAMAILAFGAVMALVVFGVIVMTSK